jgi:hypothetical protein
MPPPQPGGAAIDGLREAGMMNERELVVFNPKSSLVRMD